LNSNLASGARITAIYVLRAWLNFTLYWISIAG